MKHVSRTGTPRYHVILTCEHAGNQIPPAYRHLFQGAEALLASHRGWDPGALDFVRGLSRRLKLPFHAVTWSRLLVEANRASTNPRVWSRFTQGLPLEQRRHILETYWWPHRRAVEADVRATIKRHQTVLHIAIHSFTNVLDGVERNADVALLYDPAHAGERQLCLHWQTLLNTLDPRLRLRRNYPYRGKTDCLPTWLRKRFPARDYLGIELEFNQALIGTPRFQQVRNSIADSIATLLR